jgi:hypothetical protein
MCDVSDDELVDFEPGDPDAVGAPGPSATQDRKLPGSME